MNETSGVPPQGEESSDRIGGLMEQLGTLLFKHKPGSREVSDFYAQHKEVPEFEELADSLIALTSHGEAAVRVSRQPPWLFGLGVSIAVCLSLILFVGIVFFSLETAKSAVLMKEVRGEVAALSSLVRQRPSSGGRPEDVGASRTGIVWLTNLATNEWQGTFPQSATHFPAPRKEANANWFIDPTAQLAPHDELGERIYVYDDGEQSTKFIPSGWMPDGQGVAQNTQETDMPHQGEYFIRASCQLSVKQWVGVYFLLDGEWEPEQGLNLFELLGADKGDPIKCRFWARARESVSVQFKIGGVHKGGVHDSLIFPISTNWIELTPEWKMYEIDLTDHDLNSVVSGFAWVCDRARNSGKDVSFDLDTIYFVKTVNQLHKKEDEDRLQPHGSRIETRL